MTDDTGTLYVVATPLGNLGDLSSRAVEVLGAVGLVVCEDTRHTARLLSHFGIRARTESLHAHNEDVRAQAVVGALLDGTSVALVSDAGTPAISDPGETLVAAAIDAGARVVPVPGPSAVIAALCASGLRTGSFRFEGFLPRKSGARQSTLDALLASASTLVLYESPRRLLGLLADIEAVAGSPRRVVVARELTKVHEEFVRGTVSEVRSVFEARERVLGECTVLVEGLDLSDDVDEPSETVTLELRQLAASLLARGVRAKTARDVVCDVAPSLSRRDAYQLVLDAQDDAR